MPETSPAPTVSVLLPVYNAGRYLSAAVESILAQTYRDFEFIILEDGSTDGSAELLQRYAARDTRIRLITDGQNRGYVARLNAGLELARGELIARMDADDVALPERFALQVAFLREHPEVVCVGGGVELMNAAGVPLIRIETRTGDAAVQQAALEGDTPIYHPTAMLRTAAARQVGGYDPDLCPAEDIDLWLKLGEIGQLDNVDALVLRYRVHDQSVSTAKQHLQLANKRRACEAAGRRRGVQVPFRGEIFRPVDRRSRFDLLLKYGWWTFQNGHWRAAAGYGLRCIGLLPHRAAAWRLLACALLKRPPAASATFTDTSPG